MPRPKFQGTVIAASNKTLKVEVARIKKINPYEKRIRRKKSYLVSDPTSEFTVGQKVTFEPSRPLSRKKRFIVTK